MNLLVVGNSHIVGLKHATELTGLTLPYVPVPLCQNFEEAITSGQGNFQVDPLWKNMSAGQERSGTNVFYDLSRSKEEGVLIIVGMKVFGCWPIFGPLIAKKNSKSFYICAYNYPRQIPFNNKLRLLSRSCLTRYFAGWLTSNLNNFSWLLNHFHKVYWIPSPPPYDLFAREKFLDEYKWYITSGLHRTFVTVFNESVELVNDSSHARALNVTFLPHALDCIDANTGFLLQKHAFAPQVPDDIHASKSYYESYVTMLF